VPSKTCLKCNTACSTCSGPVNNAVQCTACSPGYYSSTVFGPCSNCFVGCATCNGLTNTSCTSCSGTYFYLTSNNSCVTSCPALYYPSESLNQCISCDTTCLTCDGNGPNFCTSCSAGSYLSGTQCVALCTVPMMGYVTDNTCVSICPFSNFVQTSDNTCRPCPANCGICFNSTECTTCINNSFLSGKFCLLTCPAGTYPNSFTILC
jgi:proprotein convertase subtilisin/kexin type 5